MKIVIDIPKELYEATIRGLEAWELLDLRLAVKHGKLIPKGHGRVIDENEIKTCGWDFIKHHAKTDAPTIIEADKDSEKE